MYAWRQVPLLRLLIPFGAGICCSAYFSPYIFAIGALLVILLLFIGISHFFLLKHIHRRLQVISSVILLLSFFGMGIVHTYFLNDLHYDSHFSKVSKQDYLMARVTSLPSQKENSVGCQLEVNEAIDNLGVAHSVQGKAQVYLALDSHSLSVAYGDVLLIKAPLQEVEATKNPYQFDFKAYYANQNIYQNGFIPEEEWLKTGGNKTNPMFAFGYSWQTKLQDIFIKYIKDDQIRGVAQAIVFGYKDELDDEWLKAFSKTGTIHVLAVSGLHVGIIYIMLSFMLRLGSSKGRSRIVKSFVILMGLFLYTLVTGFSPSVSRAALMFGIVIVAQAFQRQTNIYNTLSFACLFLLVLNPLHIYNVGFQFSFLAVLGIVYYKDYFRNIWPQTNSLLNNINTLLAVSVAAQITTFPLGLYYFHQYPNLFMFSNLIVIPCISIILYLGLSLVLSSVIYAPLADFLASIITMYIEFIARTVQYIQDVPYAFFENVHITFGQLLVLYAFILSVTLSLVYRWTAAFYLCIALVFCFLGMDYYYNTQHTKSEVIIFDIRNETLVGFKEEGHVTFVASKGVYADPTKYDFVILPYLVNERLTRHYNIVPAEALALPASYHGVQSLGNGFLFFRNKSYLFLDQYEGYLNNSVQLDYLLIGSKKGKVFLNYANKFLEARQTLIMDTWQAKSIRYESAYHDSNAQMQYSSVIF